MRSLGRLFGLGVVLMQAACGSAAPAHQPAGSSTSGVVRQVSGAVVGTPGCPGPERLGSPCPPRPMPGAVVEIRAGTVVVARTTAGTDGRFQLSVPPGTYRIIATAAGPLGTQDAKDLTVATAPVTVDLTVD